MADIVLQNKILCEYIWNNRNKRKSHLETIMEHIKKEKNYNKTQLFQIKKHITNNFISKYVKYWSSANRTRTNFIKKYTRFMESDIKVTFKKINLKFVANINDITSFGNIGNRGRGRPYKSYEDCSSKTKKRRVHELRDKYNQELLRAAVTPKKRCKCSLLNDEHDEETIKNKVLAMYMGLGLSRRKYELLRTYNERLFGNKFYPSYAKIHAVKKNCYPKDITVTEN